MKIVWVSHGAGLSGSERCLADAVGALRARKHDVYAVLPAQGELVRVLEKLGAPITIFPYPRWVSAAGNRAWPRRGWRWVRIQRAARQLAGLLERLQPDIVVTNTATVSVGAMAAHARGVPHVWDIHEIIGPEGHGLFFDFGDRSSLRFIESRSARVLVPSRNLHAYYQRWINPAKLRVVPIAVDVPDTVVALGRDDSVFTLVQVGVLTPAKRPEDAVRAVALLAQRNVPVRLRLVGAEPANDGPRLRALARELNVEQSVQFTGHVADPFAHMASADIVLMCSRGEAFPRVVIEAMKLGRPVIGADSGGIPEQIRDGWNGLLFPPGDVEALAERVERLYRDRQLLTTLGKNAQQSTAGQFTLDAYATALLTVFEEAIQ